VEGPGRAAAPQGLEEQRKGSSFCSGCCCAVGGRLRQKLFPENSRSETEVNRLTVHIVLLLPFMLWVSWGKFLERH